MNILVINAGSSSLKYQLFDMEKRNVMAKGLCERIGIDGRLKHTPAGKEPYEAEIPMNDHANAIRIVTEMLISPEHGVVKSMVDIDAVGHRVVHGAEFFSDSVIIDEEVKKSLNECVDLAPLHNPPNIIGIEACEKVMKGVPQVAVFDTAFHQTIPPEAYIYALPYEFYTKYRIRRYGFHGTSHRFVAERAAELLGKPIEETKIITCHLGNGSSITAVKNGRSVDTSMGFTPLAGVPMGTRSGDIDSAIIEFVMDKEKLNIKQMVEVLNKKSGVLGVSGVSSDFRDLGVSAAEGNERSEIALNMFCYSIKKYIGAYAAAMGGADAIVFTAGIGENNADVRGRISEGLSYMGFKFDSDKNKNVRGEACISEDNSPGKIFVIPTNEELVIAKDTERLVAKD